MNYLLGKRQFETAACGLVVSIGLMALIFIGSASINIAVSDLGANTDSDAASPGRHIISSVIFPDVDGSMEKNESQGSEKSIFFTIQAIISGQNLDNSRPDSKSIESQAYQDFNLQRIHVATTTAAISSKKAAEFTLLGAKPSGTG
jgi:hypothetical protein